MQIVHVKTPRFTSIDGVDDEAFIYRPEKGWKPIQKLAFWVLDKIGCYRTILHESVEFIRFDSDDVIEKIIAQECAIFNLCRGQPSKIYMGKDDFHRLANVRSANDMFGFDAGYEIVDGQKRHTVRGLPVIVVPYMEGILVVPSGDR